jgi:hypothetical protein
MRITLPEREDMLRRLRNVCDTKHVVDVFYPRLLKYAGGPSDTDAINLLFSMTIVEYKDLGATPDMIRFLVKKQPDFIRALIDDKKAQNDALKVLAKIRQMAKQERGARDN